MVPGAFRRLRAVALVVLGEVDPDRPPVNVDPRLIAAVVLRNGCGQLDTFAALGTDDGACCLFGFHAGNRPTVIPA